MRKTSAMAGWTRAPLLLLALGAAGFLLWVAGQFDLHGTGGYWAAAAVLAGAGFLVGLAQIHGSGGHPPTMFVLAFVPLVVCAGWVILAAQPANPASGHVLAWSDDAGIGGVVRSLAVWHGVLAFAIGLVLGAVFEPRTVRQRPTVVVAAAPGPAAHRPLLDYHAADEPVTAERDL